MGNLPLSKTELAIIFAFTFVSSMAITYVACL